ASEGLLPEGGLITEKNYVTGHVDKYRDWWSQAEAVVGFTNAYQLTKNEAFAKQAEAVWDFINDKIIDKESGEWHWGIDANGNIDTKNDKAGFWKCPYHNSRMCLEILTRM
ncbi:MAG: AGE family epimerase/isomerase, partial [Prevotellaceae bacterium]|nr:AGE family epimerase/isomerase [Prevotellaceae bacterium]